MQKVQKENVCRDKIQDNKANIIEILILMLVRSSDMTRFAYQVRGPGRH